MNYFLFSVKTPGGRLVYHYDKKPGKAPACANCKVRLQGCAIARPRELHRLHKRMKRVNRAYGGNLCHKCLKERYVVYIL